MYPRPTNQIETSPINIRAASLIPRDLPIQESLLVIEIGEGISAKSVGPIPYNNIQGMKLKYVGATPGLSATLLGESLLVVQCNNIQSLHRENHDYVQLTVGSGFYPVDILGLTAVSPQGDIKFDAIQAHTLFFMSPQKNITRFDISLHKSSGPFQIPAGQKITLVLAFLGE